LAAPEVHIVRGEVVQAFVIAPVIVVLDEAADVSFEVARQVVVLEQDAVLERLMPALVLALVWGWGKATHMMHAGLLQPLCQVA
jgi:hypothetical protein